MDRNTLQRHKREIEEDKEQLIDHIEAKLASLRQQRKKLQDPEYRALLEAEQSAQSKGSMKSQGKSVQKPVLNQVNPNQKIQKPETSTSIKGSNIQKNIIKTNKKQPLTAEEHFYIKHHQSEVKEKLNNLEEIYNKKRQLQAIGIIPASMNEVEAIYNDPKTKKKLAEYDPKAKQQKDKILKQEMERIGLMLKKKKVTNKQIQEMREHHYTSVMKDKIQELARYQELLIYNKKGLSLSLLQKQELIDIVFGTLKEFTGLLKKSMAKDFLLANQKFCQLFYITQEEIFNDLEVYETENLGEMTRNQFYEFIKTIEISNPMLNPGIRHQKIIRNKPSSKVSDSRVSKPSAFKDNTKEAEEKQIKSQMSVYLKKLFQYFDQSHEGVVQRERFTIALKRALLLDCKKQPFIKKEYLSKLGEYLQKVRQGKNKKSYYMQLEGKFLGWTQIQQYYDKFVKNKGQIESNTAKESQDQSVKSQQDEYSEFSQQKPQKEPIFIPESIPKGKLEDYFEEYGWENESESNQKSSQGLEGLKKLDNYYQTLRQQYGNQIQWNNNIRDKLSLANNQQFSEEFKQLQFFIKAREEKPEQSQS